MYVGRSGSSSSNVTTSHSNASLDVSRRHALENIAPHREMISFKENSLLNDFNFKVFVEIEKKYYRKERGQDVVEWWRETWDISLLIRSSSRYSENDKAWE